MKASSNSQDRTGLQSNINTSNDVKKTQYIKVFKAAYDPTLTKIFFSEIKNIYKDIFDT